MESVDTVDVFSSYRNRIWHWKWFRNNSKRWNKSLFIKRTVV